MDGKALYLILFQKDFPYHSEQQNQTKFPQKIEINEKNEEARVRSDCWSLHQTSGVSWKLGVPNLFLRY